MSKRFIALAAALLTSGALVACLTGNPSKVGATAAPSAASGAPVAANVDIEGFVFKTPTLTIPKGSTVTWTNKDGSAHSAKKDGTFLTEDLAKDQVSKPIKFDTLGTLDYVCGIHSGMKAKIVVE